MNLTIDIPQQVEARLRQAFAPDLNEAAKEALLLAGYRAGRISLGFVAEVLGLPTRFDAQRWLAERNEPLNYDVEELEADRETLRKHFGVDL